MSLKPSHYKINDIVHLKNYSIPGRVTGVTWFNDRPIEYTVTCHFHDYRDAQGFNMREYLGAQSVTYRVAADDLKPQELILGWEKAMDDCMIVPKNKECECGMEKHGFANHSRWCPKHD